MKFYSSLLPSLNWIFTKQQANSYFLFNRYLVSICLENWNRQISLCSPHIHIVSELSRKLCIFSEFFITHLDDLDFELINVVNFCVFVHHQLKLNLPLCDSWVSISGCIFQIFFNSSLGTVDKRELKVWIRHEWIFPQTMKPFIFPSIQQIKNSLSETLDSLTR